MVHDVWVDVDVEALRHNLRQVRRVLAGDVKLMAVVKGNGFGHGYVEPSRAFLEAGADALAVTRIEEALTIREGGISAPILLFAPIQAGNARIAVEVGLDMTVTSLPLVEAISQAAAGMNRTARVYVKVDSGMARLGVQPKAVPAFLKAIAEMPGVEVGGVYTHFATAADADASAAVAQLQRFQGLLRELKHAGIEHGLASAANSAGLLRIPESQLDMVRPGTLLYGQYPSAHVPRKLDLKPTWKLKARICEIKRVPKGTAIGYGAEFTTKRDTRTAVIAVGFADGFTLVPEGPVYRQGLLKFAARKVKRALAVEVRGKKAPVLGRVAMQLTVIDVTDIPGVEVGDEVVVPALRIPTNALIPRVYSGSSS